jgi:hypothetical protein
MVFISQAGEGNNILLARRKIQPAIVKGKRIFIGGSATVSMSRLIR